MSNQKLEESIQNFEEAIKRLSTDTDYCDTITFDPDRLKKDFGLGDEDIEALEAANGPGLQDGTIRPVAICCTCYSTPLKC